MEVDDDDKKCGVIRHSVHVYYSHSYLTITSFSTLQTKLSIFYSPHDRPTFILSTLIPIPNSIYLLYNKPTTLKSTSKCSQRVFFPFSSLCTWMDDSYIYWTFNLNFLISLSLSLSPFPLFIIFDNFPNGFTMWTNALLLLQLAFAEWTIRLFFLCIWHSSVYI